MQTASHRIAVDQLVKVGNQASSIGPFHLRRRGTCGTVVPLRTVLKESRMVLTHNTGKEVVMAQPEKTFRMGFVSASVFVNDYEVNDGKRKTRRSRRNVVLQRSYKEGDEWKQTNSFGLGDLPAAIRVLELAQNHVESQEVESAPD